MLTTVAFAVNKGPMNLQGPVDVNGQQLYGVERVRVADASILPRVTTGNTMAPCIVIGEWAAAILQKEHGLQCTSREN